MKKIMILLLILVAVPFAVALKTGIIIENKNYNKEDQLPSNLELHVTYEHENGTGTTEKDCFTGDEITCITRDLSGAPFNSGTGSVSWGCGECEDVTDWYTALDSTFKNGCVEGSMPNIIGKELCLQTDNVGQWNVVFSSFQSKGGGEFSYQRDYYTDSEGTTIDEEGVLYKGCVEINSGDSVYDLLKKFDEQNDNLDLTIDGGTLGVPGFLRAINSKEGKCEDLNIYNCMMWSGWNFWISENNINFVEPPELAPGWGMSISDYNIEKEEVIGINFATTEYNLDWTVKTAPQKPGYIKYNDLCNKLEVKDVIIDVDDKKEKSANENGGTIDVKPGSKINIEVELKNLYDSDIELKNVYIEAISDDLDVEEESDEKDIKAGKDKTFDLNFKLPLDLDSDSYDLTLNIYAEDESGMEHNKEISYDIDVDREKHSITLTDIKALPENLFCRNGFAVSLDLLNTGEEDEEVTVVISNQELGIQNTETFELEEGDTETKSYSFNIEDKFTGEYTIDIEATHSNKVESESVSVRRDCELNSITNNQESVNNKDSDVIKEDIKIEVTKQSSQITRKQEQNTIPYIILGSIFAGILIAIIMVISLKKH